MCAHNIHKPKPFIKEIDSGHNKKYHVYESKIIKEITLYMFRTHVSPSLNLYSEREITFAFDLGPPLTTCIDYNLRTDK